MHQNILACSVSGDSEKAPSWPEGEQNMEIGSKTQKEDKKRGSLTKEGAKK